MRKHGLPDTNHVDVLKINTWVFRLLRQWVTETLDATKVHYLVQNYLKHFASEAERKYVQKRIIETLDVITNGIVYLRASVNGIK